MATRRRVEGDAVTACVLYARVSTQRQAEHGVSLDAQQAACERFAASKGWPVVASFRDEGISGRKGFDERPGLRSVVDAVQGNPTTAVVVYSLSRLGRSQRMVAELLDESGPFRLRVCSVSEPIDMSTALGKAIAGVVSVFAQLESDLASERTRDALAYAKTKGTRLGAPSMLESVDAETGERTLDPERVELVRTVQRVAVETGLSLRGLADELERRGVRSVKGAKWHPRTLRLALAYKFVPPGGANGG